MMGKSVTGKSICSVAHFVAVISTASALSAQQPSVGPDGSSGPVLFEEQFDSGLGAWRFPLGEGHRVVVRDGRRALHLQTAALPVYALVRGSEAWANVRIEGRVLFSEDDDAYLGFIYRFRDDGGRLDFGSLYIKGNDGYVQANPHYDTNVGRAWHPESRTTLRGERSIRIGVWQRFALEVVDSRAHLYVGEMSVPAMTSRSELHESGGFGFKPRNPGAGVHIADLRVTAIEGFSYQGPPIPDPPYRRGDFVTDWQVLGPLPGHATDVERAGRPVSPGWRPLSADHRGAMPTASITDFRGPRRVAYLHAIVESDTTTEAELVLSTVDDLAIWVNGAFVGFAGRQRSAWWDADENEEHPPLRADVSLVAGPNDLLVRVVGGVYASGGFYLRVRRRGEPASRGAGAR